MGDRHPYALCTPPPILLNGFGRRGRRCVSTRAGQQQYAA
jgi:hypothetical protein